ncbi:leucine-rich repeat extensin-like protein 2 [Dermochelys coriacea]|uniref:leucine-rich repeat extensin-like protein 2 n=1 Tax=Dermochelys coriacea TaxID=27794 RepID=UPI001CA9CFD3|nr:leucine-rich repeat extensin-like protein 2 [Dermochelys coriacea]
MAIEVCWQHTMWETCVVRLFYTKRVHFSFKAWPAGTFKKITQSFDKRKRRRSGAAAGPKSERSGRTSRPVPTLPRPPSASSPQALPPYNAPAPAASNQEAPRCVTPTPCNYGNPTPTPPAATAPPHRASPRPPPSWAHNEAEGDRLSPHRASPRPPPSWAHNEAEGDRLSPHRASPRPPPSWAHNEAEGDRLSPHRASPRPPPSWAHDEAEGPRCWPVWFSLGAKGRLPLAGVRHFWLCSFELYKTPAPTSPESINQAPTIRSLKKKRVTFKKN